MAKISCGKTGKIRFFFKCGNFGNFRFFFTFGKTGKIPILHRIFDARKNRHFSGFSLLEKSVKPRFFTFGKTGKLPCFKSGNSAIYINIYIYRGLNTPIKYNISIFPLPPINLNLTKKGVNHA